MYHYHTVFIADSLENQTAAAIAIGRTSWKLITAYTWARLVFQIFVFIWFHYYNRYCVDVCGAEVGELALQTLAFRHLFSLACSFVYLYVVASFLFILTDEEIMVLNECTHFTCAHRNGIMLNVNVRDIRPLARLVYFGRCNGKTTMNWSDHLTIWTMHAYKDKIEYVCVWAGAGVCASTKLAVNFLHFITIFFILLIKLQY